MLSIFREPEPLQDQGKQDAKFSPIVYYLDMRLTDLKNPFNAPIYHEKTLSSTMNEARRLAGQNAVSGTVVCADFQEAGRGRQGRPWFIDQAGNLMFTIFLRYGEAVSIPKALTLRTGLAVSLALEDFAPELRGAVYVKWPNDVMIGLRPTQAASKVAGILLETDGNSVFTGIGVNITQEEFPEVFRSKAAGLVQFLPDLPENARFILLEKILARLHEEINPSPESGNSSENGYCWRDILLSRLYKKGETVVFAEGAADSSRLITGILSGLGSEGELLIIPEGEKNERSFTVGELRVY